MTVIIDGTTGIDSPGGDVSVSQSLSGNLTFTGTGNRITGDFSNATVASRVAFQTSTASANTRVGMMPTLASGGTSGPVLYSTSDPSNSSIFDLRVTDGSIVSLLSDKSGTGTYLPMTFQTGGSERARIDTSGNVGIGTTSPATKLHVLNSTAVTTEIRAGNSVSYAALLVDGTGASQLFAPGGTQIFNVNGAERMRINSSGNMGIGTASPTQRLSVSGNLNVTGGQLIAGATTVFADGSIGTPSLQFNSFVGAAAGAVSVGNSTSAVAHISFKNPNGHVGQISTTGTTTTYSTSSDYRLKENVAPMQNALATVAALKPVTYTWKADGSAGQGFIAHELQEVVPECVTGEKDAVSADGSPMYQGVDTSFLVATLVAAIQELTARLEAVENK